MALTLRFATAGDAESIAWLGRGLNLHEGRPTGAMTARALRRDGFGADPAFGALLAERDAAPVGYALFYAAYDPGTATRGLYLADIYVVAEARRQGIGRALMARLAAEARRRGFSFLWWASRPANAEANAFYRELGAVAEPIHAHALTFGAFDALADEAEAD